MVKVNDDEIIEDLYYHKEHFWVCMKKRLAKFGITDYGQKGLVRVIAVELPEPGTEINKNKPYGAVMLWNGAVFDLIAPLSGIVRGLNKNLEWNPDLINKDPYGEGWFIVVNPSNLDDEIKDLMDFKSCVEFYRELQESFASENQ